MSIRLNKDIRHCIANNAVKVACGGMEKTLIKEMKKLAYEVRDEAFQGKKPEYLAMVAKIKEFNKGCKSHHKGITSPDKTHRITINNDGHTMTLFFGGKFYRQHCTDVYGKIIEDVSEYSPFCDYVDLYVLKDESLKKRVKVLMDNIEAWRRRKEDVKHNVFVYVNSVSTVKRLLEIWPEAKDLIPQSESKAVQANLPAIPLEQLNALIGVPIPEKEIEDNVVQLKN